MRQLLLELDSFCDVSCVEDDATDPPFLAKIGHMCLEMPPLAGRVEHPKDDLGRATADGGRPHGGTVLRVQKSFETVAQKFGFAAIHHFRDRPAHVATSLVTEYQHEIGG